MRYLRLLVTFLLVLICSVGSSQQRLGRIYISNESPFDREAEVVSIPMNEVLKKTGGTLFRIRNESSEEVPYQLEYAGDAKPRNVLIQLSLRAGAQVVYEIYPGTPVATQPKTYARYVPERKDDFAWENDMIAFRMYGKALETASDNATGTDIWSKRTSKLVIDRWYKGNDYHTDHGEGMDYYQVGISLGAGDIAPYFRDSIIFPANYHHYKILDNAPLRSTFELGYDAWKVGERTVTVSKRINLDAGSQLNRIETIFQTSDKKPIEVVVGIVSRNSESPVWLDKKNGIMGYWEPEVPGKGIMGIGVISLNPKDISAANGHYLSRLTAYHDQPLVYYNGGAWNKAEKITSSAAWFSYLNQFQQKQMHPLSVSVSN